MDFTFGAGEASAPALVGLIARHLFAVLAQRFVGGLFFSDMLCRLSPLILPHLQIAHRHTTQRRARTGVRQDVVYIAPSLDEVHITPPNELNTLKELQAIESKTDADLARYLLKNLCEDLKVFQPNEVKKLEDGLRSLAFGLWALEEAFGTLSTVAKTSGQRPEIKSLIRNLRLKTFFPPQNKKLPASGLTL